MADYLVTDTELTSIADAIRTKGGTSASLEFPTEFVSAINDIETGGGGDTPWYKGDGKTYLHIDIYDEFFLTVNMLFIQSVNGGNTIDWGDGVVVTPSGTSRQLISHTYLQTGEYVITVTNTSGYFAFGNSGSTGSYIFTTSEQRSWNSWAMYSSILRKAELGTGWNNGSGRQFLGCKNLTDVYVSVPLRSNSFGVNMFSGCLSLRHIGGVNDWNAPVTTINNSVFSDTGLSYLQLFPNATTIPNNYMSGTNTAYDSTLTHADIWEGVTTINTGAFRYCLNMFRVTIPSTVTSIASNAFEGALGVKEIHLKPTTPPSLGSTNAIPNSGVVVMQIYVPYSTDHSILEAYQTATNWSTYASKMVEEPE